jgi:putative transcriptional regulator
MRETDFQELLQSVREAGAILAGTMKPARVTRGEDVIASFEPDAARIRKSLKLSQAKFATLLGISVDTLQNWEQGRRTPDGPARVLLRVASTHPEALLDVARRPARSTRKRNALRRG